jgi:conjugative transfer signal peptidase TraF
MRTVIIFAIAAVAVLDASTFVSVTSPLLIWNASDSAPRGLYRKAGTDDNKTGEWVLMRAPRWADAMAVERKYLPSNVPLIKKIAAGNGDIVCRQNRTVTRNGHVIAVALDHDSHSRPLPRWSGCLHIGGDQIFVINTPSHSFDSRYFGPVNKERVIEEIVPLWTF